MCVGHAEQPQSPQYAAAGVLKVDDDNPLPVAYCLQRGGQREPRLTRFGLADNPVDPTGVEQCVPIVAA
jgi:hypothetical protein